MKDQKFLMAVTMAYFFMGFVWEAGAMTAVVVPLGKAPVVYQSAPARTGQEACYYSYVDPYYSYVSWAKDQDCENTARPPGQDGELRPGMEWPVPRFTDLNDGTVQDNLTGLIWLRNASCLSRSDWGKALVAVNALQSGACGLTDGSVAGDWHLPTVRELSSLVDYSRQYPALSSTSGLYKWTSGDPFTGVMNDPYWTSTTDAWDAKLAWYTDLNTGRTGRLSKQNSYYVWPVKARQR